MTKSQKYFIAAVLALFVLVIFVFRADVFLIKNRPGVTSLLQNVVQPYGLSVFLMLFGYFLAKGFNTKWWLFIALFLVWELLYITVLSFGASFLPESTKEKGWFGHFKRVALENRSMIQFQELTAQYDKELFYTLKPGESTFKSFEFNTKYNVNELGMRDDSISLEHPQLLFLGDSFTMGWGVNQEETFASIVERSSGLRTLNTGISSYGTARESRIMARVKVDSLKLIVIQYHDTDLEENNYFIKNKRLGSRTQLEFDDQVTANKKYLKYYPFKYLKTAALNLMVAGKESSEGETGSSKLGGVYSRFPNYLSEFYEILDSVKSMSNVPIVITYTGSFYTNPQVIKEFEAYARKRDIENLYFVNLGDKLDYKDYFFFDDHINVKGHQVVADHLIAKIRTIKGFESL